MNEDLTQLGLLEEGDIVLDEAALSLALLDHPGMDTQPYHELLAALGTHLAATGATARTASERASALSHVLSDEFGFAGDQHTYDDPANADLIRVIDRRRGLPVSLSILYVAAARRLGWATDILNVPGHVLVMVGTQPATVIIDPFRGGTFVPSASLSDMLSANGHRDGTPPQVQAMSNRAILIRLVLNQATRAEHAGDARRALLLYERMTTIAPAYGHPWWQRARLELAEGDVAAARSSLTAILEITREPRVRQRVVEALAGLVAN